MWIFIQPWRFPWWRSQAGAAHRCHSLQGSPAAPQNSPLAHGNEGCGRTCWTDRRPPVLLPCLGTSEAWRAGSKNCLNSGLLWQRHTKTTCLTLCGEATTGEQASVCITGLFILLHPLCFYSGDSVQLQGESLFLAPWMACQCKAMLTRARL